MAEPPYNILECLSFTCLYGFVRFSFLLNVIPLHFLEDHTTRILPTMCVTPPPLPLPEETPANLLDTKA